MTILPRDPPDPEGLRLRRNLKIQPRRRVQRAAIELEVKAHADLARFGGEAVERASGCGDAISPAEAVAEAFLALGAGFQAEAQQAPAPSTRASWLTRRTGTPGP
jgi:hypothetical protein